MLLIIEVFFLVIYFHLKGFRMSWEHLQKCVLYKQDSVSKVCRPSHVLSCGACDIVSSLLNAFRCHFSCHFIVCVVAFITNSLYVCNSSGENKLFNMVLTYVAFWFHGS